LPSQTPQIIIFHFQSIIPTIIKMTQKIIYWVATGLLSAMMLMSAFMYFSGGAEFKAQIAQIGIPLFFIHFLGVAKILGAAALLYPRPHLLKEWAYAGFTFTFLGAIWTHISTSTSFVGALVALSLLGVSYYLHRAVIRPSAAA
jgi:uncharacterized membrane protein